MTSHHVATRGALLLCAAVLWACAPASTGSGVRRAPATPAPAQAAPPMRSAPAVAENACLRAVGRQTNNRDVSVLRSDFSQANSLVTVGVGAQRAPWRCLVSNDGHVEEVSFAGSEGAL